MVKDQRDRQEADAAVHAAEAAESPGVEETVSVRKAEAAQMGEAPTFGLEAKTAEGARPPQKKMSRLMRSLLMFVGLLVVVGAAWGAVSALTPEPSPSAVTPAAFALYTYEEKDLLTITVENQFGSFEFYPVTSSSGSLNWNIRGHDMDKLSQSKLLDIADIGKKLMATELVTDAPTQEDLIAYGLVSPQAKVTVQFKNGEKKSFDVGAARPDGEGAYCLMKDTNEIYCIWQSTQTYLLREVADFWNFPDIEMTTDELRYLKIIKEGVTTFEIEDVTDGVGVRPGGINTFNTWHMSLPYQKDLNTQRLDEWFALFSAHSLDYMIEQDVTDLAQYGLDKPSLEVEYRMSDDNGGNQRTVNIKVGAVLPDGKSAMCIVNDEPTVYSIAANTFDYVNVKPLDLIDRNIEVVYIGTVDDVTVSGPEGSFTIKIERDMHVDKDGKPVIDADTGEQKFDERQYLNGKQTPELTYTRRLYEYIISVQIQGVDTSDVSGQTPLYEIVYNRNTEARQQIRIGFYPYQKDYLSVTLDGKQLPFYVSRQEVQELITRRCVETMDKINAKS